MNDFFADVVLFVVRHIVLEFIVMMFVVQIKRLEPRVRVMHDVLVDPPFKERGPSDSEDERE